MRSEEFQQVVQGKLVTLEELVHMRRVLTAASLENLPLESSVKDDVINGKVGPIAKTCISIGLSLSQCIPRILSHFFVRSSILSDEK